MTIVDRRRVLYVIDSYRRHYGYSPSMRDVQEMLRVKSSSSAYYWLSKLQEEGLVSYEHGRRRTVHLTSAGYDSITGLEGAVSNR